MKASQLHSCFDAGKNTKNSHYDFMDDIGIYFSSSNGELMSDADQEAY